MTSENASNTLQLAKQGDPKAIASLINRQLQPKGITAKASLKDGFLQIMLESASVPKQQVMVTGLRKLIASFDVESIQKLQKQYLKYLRYLYLNHQQLKSISLAQSLI